MALRGSFLESRVQALLRVIFLQLGILSNCDILMKCIRVAFNLCQEYLAYAI